MFSDLCDSISRMLSWRWPETEGEITAVRVVEGNGFQLLVEYKFRIANDGWYDGEVRWPPSFGSSGAANISDRLRVGQSVTVRYRHNDPSVNTLDQAIWQDLEGI